MTLYMLVTFVCIITLDTAQTYSQLMQQTITCHYYLCRWVMKVVTGFWAYNLKEFTVYLSYDF